MSETGMVPALALRGIRRTFRQGRSELEILKGIDLTVRPGEVVALVGPSGAGKSTLLHIAGLLESPDAGTIEVNGQDCSAMGDEERTLMRRYNLGFVYQHHHLLPEFTALENVIIPQIISGIPHKDAKDRAKEILNWMGLSERLTHRPARLSGGEQQRVAIARALSTAPKVLLADEPTGNLDSHTADEVFSILLRLARGAGLAALIATHNPRLAAQMDRTLRLTDGFLFPE